MQKKKTKRARRHSEEFKQEAVRLMEERGDRPIHEVASSLGLMPSQLYAWREKYGQQVPSKRNERGEASGEELERLRREVLQLRKERDILRKSVALFVKDNL